MSEPNGRYEAVRLDLLVIAKTVVKEAHQAAGVALSNGASLRVQALRVDEWHISST